MKSTIRQSPKQQDFLYRISIDGLPIEMEVLRPGSTYWINLDEWDDCMLLARQILGQATVSTRGVLITTTEAAASIARLQQTISPHDVRAFRFIEGTFSALKALQTDLDRSVRPHQRTIVLLLPAMVADHLEHQQIRGLLEKWQPWLAHNECAILVLNQCSRANLRTDELRANNDVLAGLVHIERVSASELIYHCNYWRSALGVSGMQSLRVGQDADQLKVQHDGFTSEQPPATASPEYYIVEKAALNDFGQAHEDRWLVAPTREETYALARKQTDATVVFSLSHFSQLPEIARLVHSLRLERGARLKLVVRELSSQLRLRDEQKLLDCGANIVIGGHLSYTRFKSLLENIQTVRYTRELARSVEDHFTTEPALAAPGLVPPERFLKHVRTTLSREQKEAMPGVLVELTPAPGLGTEQAVAQLHLRRLEDVVCTIEDKVYLFLHGCLPSLVPVVLRQLFRLPFDEIFINHIVYEDFQSIEGALERMEQLTKLLTKSPEISKINSDPSATNDSGHQATGKEIRYSPRRTRLSLS